MFSLLDDGNKIWAQSAPILILTLAEVYDNNKKRRNSYALHDLGLSTANLLLQASILGLYTHPMGGFDHSLAKKLFNISDGFEPGTMIALGYAGDPSVLPEDLLKRQLAVRLRKKISEIAFKGGLNTPVSESGS
jgi:nitroreductase